jgi:hypothetical protein
MYLFFDQAFGNEQKEKIFRYIVLCCVAPKHHFLEIYCVVLFKFHAIMGIIFFWFVINIGKDFKKIKKFVLILFHKARHRVKVYI